MDLVQAGGRWSRRGPSLQPCAGTMTRKARLRSTNSRHGTRGAKPVSRTHPSTIHLRYHAYHAYPRRSEVSCHLEMSVPMDTSDNTLPAATCRYQCSNPSCFRPDKRIPIPILWATYSHSLHPPLPTCSILPPHFCSH